MYFCHIRRQSENKCFRRIEVIIEPIISINLISFPTYVRLFFCQCSKTLPSKACIYSVQVHAEIQVLYLIIIFCICLMCLYIIIMEIYIITLKRISSCETRPLFKRLSLQGELGQNTYWYIHATMHCALCIVHVQRSSSPIR